MQSGNWQDKYNDWGKYFGGGGQGSQGRSYGGNPFSSGFGGFGGGIGSDLSQFLGGMFGDSGKPYEDFMNEYRRWADQARHFQDPYLQAGEKGLGNYQDWLNQMKDPSGFINNLMGKYQESPWSQALQRKALQAGTNAASAAGTVGSTPFAQQMQQQASDIASSGMNDWLSKVLGINTEYGQGNQFLIGSGQHAADDMTRFFQDMAEKMGAGAFGKRFGRDQDFWNAIGGGLGLGWDIGKFLF